MCSFRRPTALTPRDICTGYVSTAKETSDAPIPDPLFVKIDFSLDTLV